MGIKEIKIVLQSIKNEFAKKESFYDKTKFCFFVASTFFILFVALCVDILDPKLYTFNDESLDPDFLIGLVSYILF